MRRFKNILLVLDQDKGLLGRAVALAKNNRARLTVVDVVEKVPRDTGRLAALWPPQELQKLVVREQEEKVKKVVERARQQRIRVSGKILIGRPFQEIIREVVREGRDLVIMAAERQAGLKERLFGGTAMHLMRKCPCPVWLIKPTRRKPRARIAAAVDPDPSDQEKRLLNVKIMELASSLAQMTRSELHIIHAWTLFGESLLHKRLSKGELDKWAREETGAREALLNELLQDCSLQQLPHKTHLIKGPPEMVLPPVTRRIGADALVMGTVCRAGVTGFFIGNTAEEMLQQVRCSVLTVKPDGFVSPVQ